MSKTNRKRITTYVRANQEAIAKMTPEEQFEFFESMGVDEASGYTPDPDLRFYDKMEAAQGRWRMLRLMLLCTKRSAWTSSRVSLTWTSANSSSSAKRARTTALKSISTPKCCSQKS